MGRKWADNFTTNLASTINSSAQTLSVTTGYGALAPAVTGRGAAGSAVDHFVMTIEDDVGNREKIKVEHHGSGSDVFGSVSYPLIRGYDGTTAQSWTAGTNINVDIRVDKSFLVDAQDKLGAVAPGYLFGMRDSGSSGLTFGYFGGQLRVDGVLTTIADSSVALSASSVNYVERTAAGVVSKNTTAFTAGRLPLYEVTTDTANITAIVDRRIANEIQQGKLTKSVAGAVDVTLTADEVRPEMLEFTGVLTANINVILPLVKSRWTIINSTTGAFTLTVKGATGTGISVTQVKSSIVLCDGTNFRSAVDGAIPSGVYEPVDANIVRKNVANTFTAQQTPMNGSLTDAATIAWDGDTNGQIVAVTLGGNRTMGAPTTIKQYALYVLRAAQDGTGSRTLAWNAAFKFGTAGAPTLTTTASKVDILSFIGGSSNTLECIGSRLDAV